MNRELNSRVGVIGASKGIGLARTVVLERENATAIGISRNPEKYLDARRQTERLGLSLSTYPST